MKAVLEIYGRRRGGDGNASKKSFIPLPGIEGFLFSGQDQILKNVGLLWGYRGQELLVLL